MRRNSLTVELAMLDATTEAAPEAATQADRSHRGPAGDYPPELEADIVLDDGDVVHLRPIRPDDAAALIRFHGRLSAQSVYRRFFFVHPILSTAEATRFTQVDYHDRLALVVEDHGRLLAVGRYERVPGTDEAEVAFVVADASQHHGMGTLLLRHLAGAAGPNGITRFVAQTLADNLDMLRVFTGSGFPVTSLTEFGVVNVALSLSGHPVPRGAG